MRALFPQIRFRQTYAMFIVFRGYCECNRIFCTLVLMQTRCTCMFPCGAGGSSHCINTESALSGVALIFTGGDLGT